jgi:hypothetical protein
MSGSSLSPAAPPPQYSPDGLWWWDGRSWRPVAPPQPVNPAAVTIWARDLAAGNVPRVCIRTGVPTENVHRVSFTTTPAWAWAFIVLGALPALLLALIVSRRARGSVFCVPDAARTLQIVSFAWLPALVAFAALWIYGFAANAGWPLLISLPVLLVGLIAYYALRLSLGIKARVDEVRPGLRYVQIFNAHPHFVVAVRAQYS